MKSVKYVSKGQKTVVLYMGWDGLDISGCTGEVYNSYNTFTVLITKYTVLLTSSQLSISG